jgi:hypothetical protein
VLQYFRNGGDQARALEAGQRALAIAEKLGDFTLQVATIPRLGAVYGTLGEYRRAAEVLRRNVESLAGPRARERFGTGGLSARTSKTCRSTRSSRAS